MRKSVKIPDVWVFFPPKNTITTYYDWFLMEGRELEKTLNYLWFVIDVSVELGMRDVGRLFAVRVATWTVRPKVFPGRSQNCISASRLRFGAAVQRLPVEALPPATTTNQTSNVWPESNIRGWAQYAGVRSRTTKREQKELGYSSSISKSTTKIKLTTEKRQSSLKLFTDECWNFHVQRTRPRSSVFWERLPVRTRTKTSPTQLLRILLQTSRPPASTKSNQSEPLSFNIKAWFSSPRKSEGPRGKNDSFFFVGLESPPYRQAI